MTAIEKKKKAKIRIPLGERIFYQVDNILMILLWQRSRGTKTLTVNVPSI